MASNAMTIILVWVFSLLCGIAVLRLRVLGDMLSAIFFILNFVAAFSFFSCNTMPDLICPSLIVLFTSVSVALYRIVSEKSQKNEIVDVYGCFAQRWVMKRMLIAPEVAKPRKGVHEVKAAFADIRNFTGLTDDM